MVKSQPKRQLKSRVNWFDSSAVSLEELINAAEQMKNVFGLPFSDILVCADAGYETADVYLQGHSYETDAEYAASCRKHEELQTLLKKNKQKNKDKEYQTFLRLKKKFEKNG